jgi:hypothetical protein
MANGNNIIQYTSKTFEEILNDINSDSELVDKPNWWKRFIAGIGDVIAMWNNALANNLLLRTAYTRRNIQLLLELIDYQLGEHSTANGIVLFYIKDTATFPFTVAQSDLVGLTTGSLAVSSMRFEARSGQTVSAVSEVVSAGNVDYTTEEWIVTREYMTGEKVRLTTSSALPDPLAIDTNYYVIKVDATTIKLASTLINAYNGIAINLTDSGTGNHTVYLYSFQVQMYQQQSVDTFTIGISDGVTEFQEFNLSDKNILSDTLIVTINSLSYSLVSTWVNSISTDRHFRLFYNTASTSVLQFGNDDWGIIPPAFDVEVSYAYGGGSDSNITTINKLNVYGGTDSNIDGISNPTSLTGGEDAEVISSAKILGPSLLKARDRYVTGDDGENLALAYGGISLTNVIKNYYGLLSSKVVNIATGGGNLSGAIKTALQTYLINRTILESIDVRVEDAIITAQNTTSGAKLLSGYTWAGGVEDYFRLAWKLFWSEAGYEIYLDYQSNGVSSTTDLINTIFSESFTSADYAQITTLLDNFSPRDFNEDIQESDIIGFIAPNVEGIDYMTISAPSLPLSMAEDEITTYGTLTLSEIT